MPAHADGLLYVECGERLDTAAQGGALKSESLVRQLVQGASGEQRTEGASVATKAPAAGVRQSFEASRAGACTYAILV